MIARACGVVLLAAVGMVLATSARLAAQPAGCTLLRDTRTPPEKILRCGDSLTIRSTPGAKYELTDEGLRLDSGTVMVEFKPTEQRKDFQIMTPQAIAAVRGTRWVVEVTKQRTSTLVLTGAVEVRRPAAATSALLRPGEGVDVAAESGPTDSGRGPATLVARRWAQKRVDALLARFGQ